MSRRLMALTLAAALTTASCEAAGSKQSVWRSLTEVIEELGLLIKVTLFPGTHMKAKVAPGEDSTTLKIAVPSDQIDSPFIKESVQEDLKIDMLWQSAVCEEGMRQALATGDQLFVETNDKKFYALNAKSGFVQWVHGFRHALDVPPGATEENIYVVAGAVVHSLDRKLGLTKWRRQSRVLAASAPFIAHDEIHIGAWDRYVYGLMDGVGVVAWRRSARGSVVSRPFRTEKVIYYGSEDGTAYAVDLQFDIQKWEFATRNRIQADLARHGDLILIGSTDFRLYAVHLDTGRLIWEFLAGGPIVKNPWVIDDLVLVAAKDDGMYALQTSEEGRRQEYKQLWFLKGGLLPLAAGWKRIYVLREGNKLAAVDRSTGKIEWEKEMGPFGYRFVENAVTDVMYLCAEPGHIFAFADAVPGRPEPKEKKEEKGAEGGPPAGAPERPGLGLEEEE